MKKYMLIKIKKNIIAMITAVILIICGSFAGCNLSSKVSISNAKARLNYVYNDKRIIVNLSLDESQVIKDMLNGKKTYYDNPSCGFTENVSISFDSMYFCVACDNCPIIKYENKYLKITEEERKAINEIFERYGGTFPCI